MPAFALKHQTPAGIHAAKQPCTVQTSSFFISQTWEVCEKDCMLFPLDTCFSGNHWWLSSLVCEWRSHKVAEAGLKLTMQAKLVLLLIPTTVLWLLGMWACTAMPCYEHICLWYFKPWSLSVWSGVCGDLFTLHQDQRFNIQQHFTFILICVHIHNLLFKSIRFYS